MPVCVDKGRHHWRALRRESTSGGIVPGCVPGGERWALGTEGFTCLQSIPSHYFSKISAVLLPLLPRTIACSQPPWHGAGEIPPTPASRQGYRAEPGPVCVNCSQTHYCPLLFPWPGRLGAACMLVPGRKALWNQSWQLPARGGRRGFCSTTAAGALFSHLHPMKQTRSHVRMSCGWSLLCLCRGAATLSPGHVGRPQCPGGTFPKDKSWIL